MILFELPAYVVWCLSLILKILNHYHIKYFSVLFSLFLWYSNYAYVPCFVIIPQFLDTLLWFIIIIIFFYIQLCKFHWITLSSLISSLGCCPVYRWAHQKHSLFLLHCVLISSISRILNSMSYKSTISVILESGSDTCFVCSDCFSPFIIKIVLKFQLI